MTQPTPSTQHGIETRSGAPAIPRYQVMAPVVAHEQILGPEFEIVFYAPEIARAAQPGQFLELLFGENYAPLIRRPFSLYRVDRAAGTFSVLYVARGAFTSSLSQKRPGDAVSILGPLGRPFQWRDAPADRHILVAGGIGAPPIYFLAHEISRYQVDAGNAGASVIVINAARTEDLLVGLTEFGALEVSLHIVTDDGSRGRQGIATELLAALLNAEESQGLRSRIYACGPMGMLRAIGDIGIAHALSCQLSIETAMPCGIGICGGCATAVRAPEAPGGFRYALACTEGPVFQASDLLWP